MISKDQLKPFIWVECSDYMGFQPKVVCVNDEIDLSGSNPFNYYLPYIVYPEYDDETNEITHWEISHVEYARSVENYFKTKEDAMDACWEYHCQQILFYFKKD